MAWSCFEHLAEQPQSIAVVVMTAQGSIDSAVQAMKIGAYDFVEKPVDTTRLRTILQNATRQREQKSNSKPLAASCATAVIWAHWSAPPKKCRRFFTSSRWSRPAHVSVLITGESGTGKELVARTIHDLQPAQNKRLRRH